MSREPTCENCRYSRVLADIFENKTGEKDVEKYLQCRKGDLYIKHPEKPCELHEHFKERS